MFELKEFVAGEIGEDVPSDVGQGCRMDPQS